MTAARRRIQKPLRSPRDARGETKAGRETIDARSLLLAKKAGVPAACASREEQNPLVADCLGQRGCATRCLDGRGGWIPSRQDRDRRAHRPLGYERDRNPPRRPLNVLAAPTGNAAARLEDAAHEYARAVATRASDEGLRA